MDMQAEEHESVVFSDDYKEKDKEISQEDKMEIITEGLEDEDDDVSDFV